jgi:hypothetical protein
MAIRNLNYPLVRDLQEIGVLTAEANPKISGPIKTKVEAFGGDTSGGTKTLAETPLNIMACFTIPTAFGTNNTLTALTEDTDFSLSGSTLTYLGDQSANQVLVLYSY